MKNRRESYRNILLQKLDSIDGYWNQLAYLNDQFLEVFEPYKEIVILDLIESFKDWSK